MNPGTAPTEARPPRPYAEFALSFVLERSAGLHHGAGDRLDAVERTLGQLVRRWRGAGRLSPARDVRVAPATLDMLVSWLEGETPEDTALARLGLYQSGAVADASVPRGWIRVYLGAERPESGEARARLS